MKTEIVSSGLDKISKIRKFCAKFSTVIAQNAIFDRAPAGRTTLNLYHGITHKEIIAIQVTRRTYRYTVTFRQRSRFFSPGHASLEQGGQ